MNIKLLLCCYYVVPVPALLALCSNILLGLRLNEVGRGRAATLPRWAVKSQAAGTHVVQICMKYKFYLENNLVSQVAF